MNATLPGEVTLKFAKLPVIKEARDPVPDGPPAHARLSSFAVKLRMIALLTASNMKIFLPDAAYTAPDTGRRHVTGSHVRGRVWGDTRSHVIVWSRRYTDT